MTTERKHSVKLLEEKVKKKKNSEGTNDQTDG